MSYNIDSPRGIVEGGVFQLRIVQMHPVCNVSCNEYIALFLFIMTYLQLCSHSIVPAWTACVGSERTVCISER